MQHDAKRRSSSSRKSTRRQRTTHDEPDRARLDQLSQFGLLSAVSFVLGPGVFSVVQAAQALSVVAMHQFPQVWRSMPAGLRAVRRSARRAPRKSQHPPRR